MLNSLERPGFSRSANRATVQVKERLNPKNNRRDFFSFTLASSSSFNATLNGINRKANVDLLLRNANGQVIAASRNRRNLAETISQSLAAGSYTLEARLKGKAKTRYSITASSQLTPSAGPVFNPTLPGSGGPSGADGAGNNLGTARAITLSPTPSLFSDSVSSSDPDDYYVFTVGDASNPSTKINLSLTKTGQNSGATINLRDGLGNVIKSESLFSDDGGTTFSKTVAAGTYYLQINSERTTPAVYNLSLSTTPILDTAGNSIGAARPLSLSATPTSLTEFVGTGDREDFYQFTVGAPGAPSSDFTVELRGVNGNLLTGSADLRLRDSLGNSIDSEFVSSNSGGASLNRKLGSGTYFVEVETNAENLDYTLNLTSAPIADLAGNTRPTARSVSFSPTPYTDFVGAGDGDDFYRFTLFSNQTVNFTLGGANGQSTVASLSYALQDGLGNSITSGFLSTGEGTTFNRALTGSLAGTTYYFRVAPGSTTSEGTTYGLRLTSL
ncbi:MAG: hypothetical protein ACKO7W_25105 [Elainella sp.]